MAPLSLRRNTNRSPIQASPPSPDISQSDLVEPYFIFLVISRSSGIIIIRFDAKNCQTLIMSDFYIFSISFKSQSKTLPKHELVRFPGEKPGKTQQEFGFSLSGLLLLLVRAHSLESIRTQFWSHLHHTCIRVQQGHGHTFVAFQINFKPIWFCNKRDAMEKCRWM